MKRMKLLSAVLAALLIWFGAALVRVENERYALATGLCKYDATSMQMSTCLQHTSTRTGWWWHLYYALQI